MTFSFKLSDLYYSMNEINILENISINIEDSPLTIISGNNGVGKTTFLKILYGLYSPTSGYIKRLDRMDNKAFVFQTPVFLNTTVYYNLNHALYCKSVAKNLRYNIIDKVISKYDLHYLLQKKIKNLSGGEVQIVSLLRSLVLYPEVLYYDEPSNNLDNKHIEMIIDIINNLIISNTRIFMITHDSRLKKNLVHKNLHFYSNKELHYEK